MPNVAGKAYAMNVVTPINPKTLGLIPTTWLKILIFRFSRAVPSHLGGLLGLSIIHFARWVIIKRDQWPDLGQGKQQLKHDPSSHHKHPEKDFMSHLHSLAVTMSQKSFLVQ